MSVSVAVVGANGALGSAFIKEYMSDPNIDKIYALSRVKPDYFNNKVIWSHIDYFSEESIIAASDIIKDKLDCIIVASGILHTNTIQPEKALKDISMVSMQTVYAANTIAPALIAKHFLKHLVTDRKAVFTVLSARVGSISDNHLGGWFSYRASKAALNMIIKNIAIEYCRFHKNAVITSLHPGTVVSYLSEPFKDKVSPEKVFTPDFAAKKCLAVIDTLSPQDSGYCFAYDGSKIDP